MPAESTFVIHDLASLRMWERQLHNIMQPRNLSAVQFQLKEFSSEQNRSFTMLADGYRKACGCASSSFFMSVAVVATLISYFVSGSHPINMDIRHVLTFAGITVSAALSGKLFGLLWARWRSWRLAASVHRALSAARQGTTSELV